MIETSQLHTLVAVAKAKSFSHAAKILGVTQSAISQSIKNLETKIDMKLFKRAGKKVVLTPEGEKLFQLSSSFLDQLNDTIDEIKNDKDSMSGKIRIGTLTGIGKSWLAHEMLAFATENPELKVAIKLGFEKDLVKDFENYDLDFVILPEHSMTKNGEKVFIYEEELALVYPKSSQFGVEKDLSLDALSKIPTILFEREDFLYSKWCSDHFGDTPSKVNTRYIINSHGNMLEAVCQGLGVAVIPAHVLKRSYYRDKVNIFVSEKNITNGKFYLLYHKDACDFLRIKTTVDRLVSKRDAVVS